jgi:hypothetical protein
VALDERQYYTEKQTTRTARLNCPYCRSVEEYSLRWLLREKKDRLPPGAGERDRAKFAKSQSYMVLLDDKVSCVQPRCRRTFEISGIKTTALL